MASENVSSAASVSPNIVRVSPSSATTANQEIAEWFDDYEKAVVKVETEQEKVKKWFLSLCRFSKPQAKPTRPKAQAAFRKHVWDLCDSLKGGPRDVCPFKTVEALLAKSPNHVSVLSLSLFFPFAKRPLNFLRPPFF